MTGVRRLIKGQGRSITWVAAEVGIERSYLSRMLAGERPMPPAVAERLAALLGVQTDAIALDRDREAVPA